MPTDEAAPKEGEALSLVLQSELSPADAGEEKERAMAAVIQAEEAGQPLHLEVDGESLNPCALQMILAVSRSLDARDQPHVISDRARAALDVHNIAV